MDKKELKEYLEKILIFIKKSEEILDKENTFGGGQVSGMNYIVKELDKEFKLGIFDD